MPRARWKRALDWFWCGAAMSQVREALAREPAARRDYGTRARTARDFARRAVGAHSAGGPSGVDPVACELYRQAIYWALLALRSEQSAGPPPSFADLLREPELRSLLGSKPSPSPTLELLVGDDGLESAERTVEEQSLRLFELRDHAERLIARLEAPRQALDALRLRRLVRLFVVLLALGSLAVAALLFADWREQSADLAQGKAWRASSSSVGACTSPLQYCDETPGFFFHTAEENDPWVEIDLGAPSDFSAVKVINRRDCCSHRASPLVVEVSSDQQQWKQLARREGAFRSWKVQFPMQRARYVRVRAVGYKLLHLAAVRVLP
jgi:hypothetical protein